MSELQEVIELLHIELVILPEFGGLFGRNGLYFLPFCLESLHLVEGLVGFFGCSSQLLYALQYLEFSFQVLLFLQLLFLQEGGSALTDDLHGRSENGFLQVHRGHECILGASFGEVLLACFLSFSVVEFVEELLEQVKLLLIGGFSVFHNLLGTCHHLFFGLVYVGRRHGFTFSRLWLLCILLRLFLFFCRLLHRGILLRNLLVLELVLPYFFFNLSRLLQGSGLVSLG